MISETEFKALKKKLTDNDVEALVDIFMSMMDEAIARTSAHCVAVLSKQKLADGVPKETVDKEDADDLRLTSEIAVRATLSAVGSFAHTLGMPGTVAEIHDYAVEKMDAYMQERTERLKLDGMDKVVAAAEEAVRSGASLQEAVAKLAGMFGDKEDGDAE